MKNNTTKRSGAPTQTPDFIMVSGEYFDRIEHYKSGERQTIWIKLYLDLLDDFNFITLPDEMKWHFVGLMMLAAKTNNRLQNNTDFLAQRIGATSKIDVDFLLNKKMLLPCKPKKTKGNFASKPLAKSYQSASPEKEEEKEEEKEKEEETHTEKEQESAIADSSVNRQISRNSIHSFEICRDYTLALEKAGKDDINSVVALAKSFHRDGKSDHSISEWLQTGKIDYKKPSSQAHRRSKNTEEAFQIALEEERIRSAVID